MSCCRGGIHEEVDLKSSPGKPPQTLTIVILPDNDTLTLGGKVLAQGNDH